MVEFPCLTRHTLGDFNARNELGTIRFVLPKLIFSVAHRVWERHFPTPTFALAEVCNDQLGECAYVRKTWFLVNVARESIDLQAEDHRSHKSLRHIIADLLLSISHPERCAQRLDTFICSSVLRIFDLSVPLKLSLWFLNEWVKLSLCSMSHFWGRLLASARLLFQEQIVTLIIRVVAEHGYQKAMVE